MLCDKISSEGSSSEAPNHIDQRNFDANKPEIKGENVQQKLQQREAGAQTKRANSNITNVMAAYKNSLGVADQQQTKSKKP